MWENAYLGIKNPKASRALKWALDPRTYIACFACLLDQILDPHLQSLMQRIGVGPRLRVRVFLPYLLLLFENANADADAKCESALHSNREQNLALKCPSP